MTRTERIELKKKYRRKLIAGYSMIGLFVLNIFLIIALRTFIMGIENEMLRIIPLICILVIPLLIGLYFSISATWIRHDLVNHFQTLLKEKNKFYFKLFYREIQNRDYEKARVCFNRIVLRSDNYRVFAHGMLIALLEVFGDEKQRKKAGERMKTILE